MTLFIAILFVLFSSINACTNRSLPQPDKVFLLAGQSNMAGRGGVWINMKTGQKTWDGIIPPECRPTRSILRLNANDTWVIAEEPLHADIDVNKTNGVGCGMPFAHFLQAKLPTSGVIGLVPCALGGSTISDWQRGTDLYKKMLTRANKSVEKGGKVAGILWQEGGSDSDNAEAAKHYKEKVVKFFNDLREDIKNPDFVILQIAIAAGKRSFTNLVREAQYSIKLPNLQTVDCSGLPVGQDGVHLNSDGQVRLGRMLSDAYVLQLQQLAPQPSPK